MFEVFKRETLTKKTEIMNTYNIFEQENESTILFHAIAKDKAQVKELAEEAGFDIEGMTIELIRTNVKNEMGRYYQPSILNALV